MSTVKIELIKVKDKRRPLKPEKVAELKESIATNGLLNPITLDQELNLIAGLHRLTACQLLGFKQIECNIITCEDTEQARLAEIDENLIRSELEALERAELWLEREQILEKIGLRAKPGDNQHIRQQSTSLLPLKTTQELAKETGYSKRTYQYGKQIASQILPEVKQVIKNSQINNKITALLEIARAGSEEHKQAEEAEKAKRQAQIEGDKEEAQRQALILDRARAKQKELQLLTLAEVQKKKAKSATKKLDSETQASEKHNIRVGDEWLLDRHMVYCGDTTSNSFINILPSEAALAIITSASNWNYDYLINKARVVAVILEEGQIYDFCKRQQMPFRLELLLGKIYVAIFSHQSFSQPRKPTEIEGIEGIVSYLVSQYTNTSLGLFVLTPNLGNGEILITCQKMGRICFAGDKNPEKVARAIARWQNWTGKSAVRES